MADTESWTEKYIKKIKGALKARTGSESLADKRAREKKEREAKRAKKKKGNPNAKKGPADVVKYN